MIRLRRPRLAAPFALLCVALTLTACSDRRGDEAGAGSETPVAGGAITIAGPSDLEFANPLVSQEVYTQEVNRYLLFTPLVRYDTALNYVPALAESWEMLGDTGVIFRLRRDLRWHDGPVTSAADVAFTYERAKDPATGFPNTGYFEHWTGIEVIDSFTVRFSFAPHLEPLAGLPFLPIVPKHLLESVAPDAMRQAAFNKNPVGNGPYRFVEQRANDRWVFDANDDYPEALGGRPYIDRVVWRVIPDNQAQVIEIRSGNVDLVLTPEASMFAELDASPDLRGVVRPTRQFALIGWNTARPPLDDPDVRYALAHAIDRGSILNGLRYGLGELGITQIAPFSWAHDASLEPLPYDTAAARRLLAEQGIRDSDGDGTLERADGQDFAFTLMTMNTPFNRDAAELIRGDLTDIGVRVDTRVLDPATVFGTLSAPQKDFDAALLGWEDDFRPNLKPVLHSNEVGGPYQFASYRNPALDSLMDRAAVTTDRDEATRIYARIQQILQREQPWTVLYYFPSLAVLRERVKGVQMDIRGALATVTEWWVAQPAPADSAADAEPAAGG